MLIWTLYGALLGFLAHEGLKRFFPTLPQWSQSLVSIVIHFLAIVHLGIGTEDTAVSYGVCLFISFILMSCSHSLKRLSILICLSALTLNPSLFSQLFLAQNFSTFLLSGGQIVLIFLMIFCLHQIFFCSAIESQSPAMSFISHGLWVVLLGRTIIGHDGFLEKIFLQQLASLNLGFLGVYAVGHAHPSYYPITMAPALVSCTFCLFFIKTPLWFLSLGFCVLLFLKKLLITHLLVPYIQSPSLKQASSYLAELSLSLIIYLILRSPLILDHYQKLSLMWQNFSIHFL